MKKVHNLIILDESGSMECIREQALTGLNETLQSIVTAQGNYPDMEQRTTVLLFDSTNTRYVFKNDTTDILTKLSRDEYRPNACTPLFDAIGKGISTVKSVFSEGDAAIVTIITDGYENASVEYSLKQITHLIDTMKEKGWTFAFIGTDNLDVESMAKNFHIDNHLAFAQDEKGTRDMFQIEMKARKACYDCLAEGYAPPSGKYFEDDDE